MANKILLIDDSTTQLESLKIQFTKAGFEVKTAQDGADGYKKVFENAPDIILSDVIMPNLNGYQLCRLLKNTPATKKIPIVLFTVLDKKIDEFWAGKSGADAFMSKNENFEDLHIKVCELLEQKRVSEDYKKFILNQQIREESVQNQINDVLDELLMNSTFLNEFRDLGEYLTHEKVLIEKTFELLSMFIDYNVAGIFFKSLDKNDKNILHLDINKSFVSNFVIEKIKRDFFSNMPDMPEFTIRDFGHDIVREKINEEEKIVSFDDIKSSHVFPIIFEDKLLGGVCFFSNNQINYSDFKFYNTMVSEFLLLFKMRFLYSETEYLSVTDGLTGLYNRRHFEYNLEREFSRVMRYKGDLSLAIIDIDFFKKVNDTYGHQYGDYVLREISDILSASFRKTDMIYRYGGEEMAIILTETTIENALIPIERLREKISQYKFCYNDIETNITVSIGLSTNFETIETEKDFVESADKALYKAKQDGRNRVVIYSYEQFAEISK
ncbi:MAG TPA: diguanylate cyclase [Candidatus Gastranaerophilaceae bacterium]|nr:diguanylate cyclase [Candidatus Gastranaerophilaceae bacterium]HPT41450.1 diguanylate cyclase [Candidatus Gastranaerophilaceae bacterium]